MQRAQSQFDKLEKNWIDSTPSDIETNDSTWTGSMQLLEI